MRLKDFIKMCPKYRTAENLARSLKLRQVTSKFRFNSNNE